MWKVNEEKDTGGCHEAKLEHLPAACNGVLQRNSKANSKRVLK
jgi:hypothetical protein